MSDKEKKLLSTSSPEGIQIASKITPTRLAQLLIRKGPLPIRHITGQLALEVQGFTHLSLSKQRRLIMSAMEQLDPVNNVVFEKIGWGQWAVRKVDSDYIVTEGTEGNLYNQDTDEAIESRPIGSSPENGALDGPSSVPVNAINVKDLRNQPNLKLGWSKKQSGSVRRESISNNKPNLHNVKLPSESLHSSSAIASDSDDEDDGDLIDDVIGRDEEDEEEDDSFADDDDEESEFFKFDHDPESKKSPPIKFANRVPLKLSPPPSHPTTNGRRKSSSSNSVNKPNFSRHQIFNRSRLNSLENLDNYIISSAKNSNGSFGSPPPPNVAAAVLSGSPLSSWNSNNYLSKSPDGLMSTMNNRRKSSFNESHIRSTLSASMGNSNANSNANFHTTTPTVSHSNDDNLSDTDEEDWATIGPESLRKKKDHEENETRQAAFALVDLMSV